MPRKNQAASANRRTAPIQSASTRRVMSAPTANANGIVHSVYPEYSIGGWTIMLGWRRSGSSPTPSAGAGFASWNGLARNAVEPGEEAGEDQEHRGRPRRHVAEPPARPREHEARPERQQPDPQQQRALLRRPHRRGAVERRRRRARVRADEPEREVRAQERALEDREREREHERQRVDRAAPRRGQIGAARPHTDDRCARAVDAQRDREEEAGPAGDQHVTGPGPSLNFDGHFVTSESFSPTNTAPRRRTVTITSRPWRNGSGTAPA